MSCEPNLHISRLEQADAHELRRHVCALTLVAARYNSLRSAMLPVEAPLLLERMRIIDEAVEPGVLALTWRSHAIAGFTRTVSEAINEAHCVLGAAKATVKDLAALTEGWAARGLFACRMPLPCDADTFEESFASAVAVRCGFGSGQFEQAIHTRRFE